MMFKSIYCIKIIVLLNSHTFLLSLYQIAAKIHISESTKKFLEVFDRFYIHERGNLSLQVTNHAYVVD